MAAFTFTNRLRALKGFSRTQPRTEAQVAEALGMTRAELRNYRLWLSANGYVSKATKGSGFVRTHKLPKPLEDEAMREHANSQLAKMGECICKRCKKRQPIEAFRNYGNSRALNCNQCRGIQEAARVEKMTPEQREARRLKVCADNARYRARNLERVREIQRESARRKYRERIAARLGGLRIVRRDRSAEEALRVIGAM